MYIINYISNKLIKFKKKKSFLYNLFPAFRYNNLLQLQCLKWCVQWKKVRCLKLHKIQCVENGVDVWHLAPQSWPNVCRVQTQSVLLLSTRFIFNMCIYLLIYSLKYDSLKESVVIKYEPVFLYLIFTL